MEGTLIINNPEFDPDFRNEPFNQIPYGEVLADRYQIQEVIGSGGMGFVYRARDLHFPKVNKVVAVKELLNSNTDILIRDEVIKIFEREANTLVTLNHSAIPKIFDFFSDKNRVFLVLEFIEGSDLKTILNEYEGFLPIPQVLSWALEICEVLAYLHHHSPDPLIFRDLKPSNIMINQNNRVVLIDFGIAKALQATEKGTIVGTEGYSPPEQYRGEVSASIDIYALGATLHYVLTRRDPQLEPPFTFDERPVEKINPSAPKDLVRIVRKALAYQPAERFQSIGEMQDALQKCVEVNKFDLERNRTLVFSKETSRPREIWCVATGDEVRGSPRLENSILYVGSYDQNLYALNTDDGSLLWKFFTQGGIVSQPLIKDSVVYFGSEDGRLFAVSNRSGKLLWVYELEGPVRSSPRIAEGHLFLGSDQGFLHAIHLVSNKKIWQANLGSAIRSSPTLSKDGLYVGTDAGEMLFVDFGGKIQWRFYTKKPIMATPALFQENVLFPSLDGNFYAVSQKNGWLQWTLRMGKGSVSTPSVSEKMVVFGSADGNIYSVDLETEKVCWQFNTGNQVSGSPLTWQNRIYVGDSAGRMYCLNSEDGNLIWEFSAQGAITGTPVTDGQKIFFGATDHHIYALSID